MLISLRWLERHIDLSGLDAQSIARDLTLRTAEVEGVHPAWEHARAVRVGHVVSREPHPDATKLSKCRVDIGEGEPIPIVCGAANVAAGQRVPVALPGTTLPGIGALSKSKIRGEISLGMICSEQEIGLSDQSEGIWVLPDSARVGLSLAELMDLDDWVIDIDNKSLTHRPDLWGHRGIARELSAIYRRPLRPLAPALPAAESAAAPKVLVQDSACARYVAVPLRGVRSQASPLWLRRLLKAVGQRSRGQLVDLSNFVMLDLGQPNHVFDAGRLSPDGIVVRRAGAGEKFTALDGSERTLAAEDLVIASGGQAVALAGVIGGRGTEVGADTQEVLLEVATFDAPTVRRASSRHALRTDSSARFEKTLDPLLPPMAAAHFVQLLQELQPDVRVSGGVADERRFTEPRCTIELRPARVRSALGEALEDAEIADLLERLHFGVQRVQAGSWLVTVPSDRATKDLTMEQDLIEEVGRLYGYGNIAEARLLAPVRPPPRDERRELVRLVQDRLTGVARFSEAISYSFQPDDLLRTLRVIDEPYCLLQNPVSAQESRIRRSLVPSLLANIEQWRRQKDEVRLFEVGKCYLPEQAAPDGQPAEQHRVSLVWATPPAKVGTPFGDTAFFKLYGVLVDLLSTVERPSVVWGPAGRAPAWANPSKCIEARVADGPVVASLSALHPEVAHQLGLRERLQSEVIVGEVSLDAILSLPRVPTRYQALPRFPGIKVDVAILTALAMPAGEVQAAIANAAGTLLRSAEVFDVYHGAPLGEGRKSLAFHVVLQSDDKTLTDTDEQKFLRRLSSGLQAIGAQLRDG